MTNSELFLTDKIPRYLKVVTPDGELLEEVWEESLELSESLCSEDILRFGCCEASVFKFRIINVVIPLSGKKITASILQDENEMQLGEYTVESDVPTADRRYRDVIAYDAMYDIIKADVAAWYNTILPNADSTVTLKEFRDSFFAHFGIEQEAVVLINDDMIVAKTVEPSVLSGKTVATAICEINGCFGHIGRNGKFQYIFLKEMSEGLYPSNTLFPRDDLYPADPMNAEQISRSHYISAKYEDFTTAKINKLQIRQEEDDIGCVYGSGDNCYIVEDNFLVYGKSHEELQTIAGNLYSVICNVWYRPASVEAKGNPCLEVGDGIKLRTTYEIVYTYILQRTLKGIQALRDTYDAEGTQYQEERVNSTHEQIRQLKGKTNKLIRTVDETRSEIKDMEKDLSTQIVQNAQQILLQAQQGKDMAAQIALNAKQILLKVSKDGVISSINQTAELIKIQAQKIDLVGLVNADELVSKFATITTLNATKAELTTLISKRATIDELEVQTARIDNIEIDYITADEVSAKYATMHAVTAVQAEIENLLNDSMQIYGSFGLIGSFAFKNRNVKWGTINGIACLVEDE